MSDIEINIKMPLDDDKMLRRECPHCFREFKVQITDDELKNLAEKSIEDFLVEKNESSENDDISDYFCPYCGQNAGARSWWTQEQLAYVHIFAKNIVAKITNEQLIRPINQNYSHGSSGLISISMSANELEYEDPWISPEPNDMKNYLLGCCDKKMKLDEAWLKDVYCFYCGFKHLRNAETALLLPPGK